jgi:hypothetical protein
MSPSALSTSPPALAVSSPTLAAAQQFTALADIARLLHGNDAALASGVRHIFDDRPMPGLVCALGPGSTGEDAARMIGGLTVSLPVAFTSIVAWATREEPRMTPVPGSQGYRKLDDGDPEDAGLAPVLGLACGDRIWGRRALMNAGTTVAAETAVTLNPEEIPAGPMGLIEKGTPVGSALAGYDLRRIFPAVEVTWPADPGLRLAAVLTVCGGRVAGFTRERVTRELLDRLAKGAADAPPRTRLPLV